MIQKLMNISEFVKVWNISCIRGTANTSLDDALKMSGPLTLSVAKISLPSSVRLYIDQNARLYTIEYRTFEYRLSEDDPQT
jgi:hypothetical protein